MRISERLAVSHLRAAVEVNRCRSFTQAAQVLGLSQSSLSRKISDVEKAVGVQVFRRTTRSVEPTVAGEAIIQQMAAVLSGYDMGMEQLERYITGDDGVITIGCLPSIAATLMPRLIRSFAADYPQVRIELRDGLLDQVASDVEAGVVDFGVMSLASAYPTLDYEPLGSDQFYCAVPTTHRFAQRESVQWKDFAGEPLISFSPASSISWPVGAALDAAGAVPSSHLVGHNVGAVAGLVASGLGITAVPGLVRPLMEFAHLVFVPVTPEVHREICIARRPGEALQAPAGRFMQRLRFHEGI